MEILDRQDQRPDAATLTSMRAQRRRADCAPRRVPAHRLGEIGVALGQLGREATELSAGVTEVESNSSRESDTFRESPP